ncbi:MAG: hypothetical protein ACE1ZS_11250 [Candidatus Poribacteria bacterium]
MVVALVVDDKATQVAAENPLPKLNRRYLSKIGSAVKMKSLRFPLRMSNLEILPDFDFDVSPEFYCAFSLEIAQIYVMPIRRKCI